MHIDPNTFPYVTLSALEESASNPAMVVADKIKDCQVKPEMVIVEGFDFWVPDPNKTQIVSPFLAEMREMAEKYDVALVGTVGCPKQKPREQYADLRSKIIGSQAWARRSETIVLVIEAPEDNPKLKLKAGDRQIHILPRNGRAQRLTVAFNDNGPRSGRMDEVVRGGLEVEVSDVKAKAQDVFREWTEQREEFTTVEAAEYFDVTLRTIQRWTEELEGWRKLPRKAGTGGREAITYRKKD
jgi:hypothetical protein